MLESIALELKDDDMKKAKRAKEVLKATEKVVSFIAATPSSKQGSYGRIAEVKGSLATLRDGTESQPMSQTCDRIIKEIEGLDGKEGKGGDGMEKEEAGDDEAEVENDGDARMGGKKSHKKKKKSKAAKKKKRR